MALTDSLIVHYACDEASGNLLDTLGVHNLTDNNTVGAGTGKISGGRDHESGDNEYFSKADHADYSAGDTDFTLQAWVKLESGVGAARRCILSKGDATFGGEYMMRFETTGDTFRFLVSYGGTSTIHVAWSSSVSNGVWYLFHGWHDSVNNLIGIAINGGTAVTASHSGGVNNTTDAFEVGRFAAAGEYMDGLLDEIAMWRRVLTADERTQLYNSGNGLAYADWAGGAAGQPLVKRMGGVAFMSHGGHQHGSGIMRW